MFHNIMQKNGEIKKALECRQFFFWSKLMYPFDISTLNVCKGQSINIRNTWSKLFILHKNRKMLFSPFQFKFYWNVVLFVFSFFMCNISIGNVGKFYEWQNMFGNQFNWKQIVSNNELMHMQVRPGLSFETCQIHLLNKPETPQNINKSPRKTLQTKRCCIKILLCLPLNSDTFDQNTAC